MKKGKEVNGMVYIKQLFFIFMFSFFGEVVSMILPFSVPGSVAGMILMFIALHFNLLKIERVEEAGDWLVNNMAIFFVPAGIGLMTNFDIIGAIWWQLLIIVCVSATLMMWFVGFIVQFFMNRTSNSKEGARL